MNKEEQIEYLNRIKPFLNLKAVCEDYNKKHASTIDYNNLRAVLNGISTTRLSSQKLDSFINYLHKDLFLNTFNVEILNLQLKNNTIKNIIESYSQKMSEDVLKEIENEIQNY